MPTNFTALEEFTGEKVLKQCRKFLKPPDENRFIPDKCVKYLECKAPYGGTFGCPCLLPGWNFTSSRIEDENTWWEKDQTLLICVVVVVLCLLFMLVYQIVWDKMQRKEAETTDVHREADEVSSTLVRHFLPSFKVEKHHFRGMRATCAQMSIAFEELGLELPNGSRVLDGVTGRFEAGRMVAIMGPSGAGKTTFMNVLCGKATYGRMTGDIYINDTPGDISEFKSVMGFVPQDDVVHETLTVSENISFSAQLRNKKGTSSSRQKMITEDVLIVMQMDHIRNSIVGGVENRGISGGQRKRVNIGMELAACPTVIFLDEPTSGLDSTSSLLVVQSLKTMAQLGMTSIMVIHQPRYSLFTLFDDVLLLGKGGRTVYLGPSLGAKPYFERLGFVMPANENPADWFMDVISGEVPNTEILDFKPAMLFDLWLENKDSVEASASLTGRDWHQTDDRAVLAKKLEEEWDKIDTDGDGLMEVNELSELLTVCLHGTSPAPEVVSELITRMTGDPRQESVTQMEFLNYLVSLHDIVAQDLSEEVPPSDSEMTETEDGSVTGSGNYQPRTLMAGNHAEAHARSPRPHHKLVDDDLQRALPGCCTQMVIVLHGMMVRWWRNGPQRFIFLGVIILASTILGIQDRCVTKTAKWQPEPYLNLHTCLALLTSVFCLGTFSKDRPVFWRESSHGLNVFSFYVARILVNTIDVLLQCFLFSAIYFLIRDMPLNFEDYFVPSLMVSFVSSGWGYFISAIVPPEHGPFVVALISFVNCGLLGHPLKMEKYLDGGSLEIGVSVFSITRWSVQMAFMTEVLERGKIDYQDHLALKFLREQYEKGMWNEPLGGFWWAGIIVLASMGVVLYLAGYLALRFMHRDKQI